MNTLMLTTNIKKEVWEYKKIFMWIPLILAVFAIASPFLNYFLNDFTNAYWLTRFERMAEAQNREMFPSLIFTFVTFLFLPFLFISAIVQLYYFTACMFDERRDMSILFWRSLPVSDAMSVGTKMLVGALVLPGFFLLAATITLVIFLILFFIGCIILSVGYDISLWGFWLNSGIIGHLFSTWFTLIPYSLWVFPVYGWLMLVSAYAKKAPFLWAILPVVIVLLAESLFVHYFNFNHQYIAHTLVDYFAITQEAINLSNTPHNADISTFSPLALFWNKVSVVALFIGAAFVYGAYWLRVNKSQ